MFSQMYVCPQGVDISGPMFFPGMLGYLWYQLHSKGAGYVGGGDHPPDVGYNGIQSASGGTHPTEMLSCMTYISGIKYVNLKISLSQINQALEPVSIASQNYTNQSKQMKV